MSPSIPFIVHALPRSRTKWISAFLSYNEWKCGHEQAILLRSIHDMKNLFDIPYSGTVETASAHAWRIIQYHAPHVRHAVILRSVDEVMESMMRLDTQEFSYNPHTLRPMLEYGNRMLHELAQQRGVLTLKASDLDTECGASLLFRHCLPHRFDPGWWKSLRDKNIQCDVPQYIRYYHTHKTDVEAFKSLLWREMRALRRDNRITRH